MSLTVGELVAYLKLDDAKFNSGLDKAHTRLKTTGEAMNKAANVGAVGFGVLSAAIGKSVIDYEKRGASIRSLQRAMGADAEGASTLVGQWERYGVEAGSATMATKTLAKAIDGARSGNDQYAAAFERLGISVDDLKNMSDTDAIFATRDALAEMGAGADRTAVAQELLGRGAMSMSNWYSQSASSMAETNALLKRSGLIWDEKEVQQYVKAAKAQAELKIAMAGIEEVIAKQVVPAMIPLVRAFGDFLQKIGPLAKVIPFLTVSLGAFVVAVKGARFMQTMIPTVVSLTRMLGRLAGGFRDARVAESAFSGTAGTLGGKLRSVTNIVLGNLRAFGRYIARVPAMIAANVALAASYTAVAVAAAATGFAIYEAIKAYQSWQDAIAQAKTDADNAAAANQKAYDAGKITREQYLSNAAGIDKAAYQTPWYMKSPLTALPGLANEGIVKARPGGTIVRVAEGREDEAVVKTSRLQKAGTRSAPVFAEGAFKGAIFVGTSRDAARAIMNLVGPELEAAVGGLA